MVLAVDRRELLYLKVKRIGKQFAPSVLGPFGTDPLNVRAAYRRLGRDVQQHLEYAKIIKADGSIVGAII